MAAAAAIPCPCCFCLTLEDRGSFELCPVCYWEDDGQGNHDADEVRGGPNGDLSLTAARANFVALGASCPNAVHHVRPPTEAEKPEWKQKKLVLKDQEAAAPQE